MLVSTPEKLDSLGSSYMTFVAGGEIVSSSSRNSSPVSFIDPNSSYDGYIFTSSNISQIRDFKR